jgi:hypothetical protein
MDIKVFSIHGLEPTIPLAPLILDLQQATVVIVADNVLLISDLCLAMEQFHTDGWI